MKNAAHLKLKIVNYSVEVGFFVGLKLNQTQRRIILIHNLSKYLYINWNNFTVMFRSKLHKHQLNFSMDWLVYQVYKKKIIYK